MRLTNKRRESRWLAGSRMELANSSLILTTTVNTLKNLYEKKERQNGQIGERTEKKA